MESTQQNNSEEEKQPTNAVPMPGFWAALRMWAATNWLAFKVWLLKRTERKDIQVTAQAATPANTQVDKPLTPEEKFYQKYQIRPQKSAGFVGGIENGFIMVSSGLSLIFFTFLLGYGNGFFFSGFQEFTLGLSWASMMYLGGFLIEGVGTSSLIIARRNYGVNRRKFAWGIAAFCIMGLVSATTQYILYRAQIAKGVIDLPANTLNQIPVFSFLLGDSTTESFIWARAVIFHAAIVIATFLIPTHTIDVHATIKKIQDIDYADEMMQRAKQQREMWQGYVEEFSAWARDRRNGVVQGTVVQQQPHIVYQDRIVEKVVERPALPPKGYYYDHEGFLVKAEKLVPQPDVQTEPTPIILPTAPVVSEKRPVELKPIELHPPAQKPQKSTTAPLVAPAVEIGSVNGHSNTRIDVEEDENEGESPLT